MGEKITGSAETFSSDDRSGNKPLYWKTALLAERAFGTLTLGMLVCFMEGLKGTG